MFNYNRNSHSSCIGADIDASHIKLVEISHHNGKFRVENYAIYSRSSEWQKQLSSNLFFTSREIITAIADTQVLSKKIRVGKKLSEIEQEEFISLEMEKVALCPINELMIDFQISPEQSPEKDEKTIEALAIAVRRQTIESIQQLFRGSPFCIKKVGLSSELLCVDQESYLPINPRISPEQWQKDAPDLVKACQYAIASSNHTLNFLPWRKEKREQRKKKSIFAGLMTILIIAIIYLFLDNAFEQVSHVAEEKTMPVLQKPAIKSIIIHKSSPTKPIHYSLKNTAIKDFKLVGYIERSALKKKNIWGIIQAPNGKIFHVTVGNVVGKEHAVVIHITSKKILLNHHNVNRSNRRYVIE